MEIEDFYKAIKLSNEPKNFGDIEKFIDQNEFSKESHPPLYPCTRLYLEKYKTKKSKISRNLVALFFPFLWCLYRRMYLWAFLFILPISYLIKEVFKNSLTLTLISLSLFAFVFSLFADSLYFKNTERRFKKKLTSKPNGLLVSLVLLLGFTWAVFRDFVWPLIEALS